MKRFHIQRGEIFEIFEIFFEPKFGVKLNAWAPRRSAWPNDVVEQLYTRFFVWRLVQPVEKQEIRFNPIQFNTPSADSFFELVDSFL